MKTVMERYQEYARLKKWPFTPQHGKIIEEIFKCHDHFTEQEIAAHGELRAIPRRTISMIVQRLVEAGLIRKIFFGADKIYFEHVYGHIHHDHLVCLECGKIIEFRDERIERQQAKVCRENQFEMIKHSLHILGLCKQCQGKTRVRNTSYAREEVKAAGNEAVPLSTVANGRRVRIAGIDGGIQLQRRLQEMGMGPGTVIEVVENHFAGPFIVRIKQSKLAIGHHITHKVLVRTMD